MPKKKEYIPPEITKLEAGVEINDVDGQPIFHADEEAGDGDG